VRNFGWLVLGVVVSSSFVFAGCGTVLYDVPASRRSDDWTITIKRLKDGPNSFPMGAGVNFVPADGQRLLYLTLTIRNEAAIGRQFSYDACDLDAGNDVVLPGLIDRDAAINALADKVESYDPGEERGRRLIYSYPGDGFPTRVSCAHATFPLPGKK
jgi:hypothetical protein